MSLKQVVSVFDSASQLFGQPFFVPALAAAVRSVGDEVNRKAADNTLNQHPDDFQLFHVGQFDDVKGEFISNEGPVLICRVKDLVQAA